MPSDTGPASYAVAFTAFPYAFPFAFGFVLTVWGVAELVPLLTTVNGTVKDLFELLVILTVGSILVFFGVAGALAVTVRDATAD